MNESQILKEMGRATSVIEALTTAIELKGGDKDKDLMRIVSQPDLADILAKLVMDKLFLPICHFGRLLRLDSAIEELLASSGGGWALEKFEKDKSDSQRAAKTWQHFSSLGFDKIRGAYKTYHIVQLQRDMHADEVNHRLYGKDLVYPMELVEALDVFPSAIKSKAVALPCCPYDGNVLMCRRQGKKKLISRAFDRPLYKAGCLFLIHHNV